MTLKTYSVLLWQSQQPYQEGSEPERLSQNFWLRKVSNAGCFISKVMTCQGLVLCYHIKHR